MTGDSSIAGKIIERLVDGHYRPGDKLPTERDLAKEIDAGRPAVREAYKALQLMGILESRQGSGTYVTEQPENTIISSLPIVFALSNSDFMDIQWFRFGVESAACRYIISNCSNSKIEKLKVFLRSEYYEKGDAKLIFENDSNFHTTLVHMPNNALIRYLYTTLGLLVNEHIRAALVATSAQNELDLVNTEHIAIYDALLARDYAAVSSALITHFELNQSYVSRLDRL